MLVTARPNTASSRRSQESNALSPSHVTSSGITTFFSTSQFWKALFPIVRSVSGNVISVSEVLPLNALSAKRICVSAGSACSSRNIKDNPVLAAYGLTKEEAESSIRLSFTENTTEEECRLLCEALTEAAKLKRS